MNLKRFFAYSFTFHAFIIVAVVLLISVQAKKEQMKGGEFFTRLVSPDEFLSGKPYMPAVPRQRSVPLPRIKPIPHVRPEVTRPTPGEEDRGRTGIEKGPPAVPQPLPPSSPSGGMTGAGRGNSYKPEKAGPSLREKLFDRGIIGDLAKRDVEKEEKENRKQTFTFDTKEYRFLIYNERLKERIESIWEYPRDAAANGIYGDLMIRFTIKKNGKLGAVELMRTSGHKSLDDAAMMALREGAPYWPLPEEWGMDAYTIEGHFVYTIYGSYIR